MSDECFFITENYYDLSDFMLMLLGAMLAVSIATLTISAIMYRKQSKKEKVNDQ